MNDAPVARPAKTEHSRYVEAFIGLLAEARPDPVKRELLARLDGRDSTMTGVRSPPVVRGEADRLDILFRVLRRLQKAQHGGTGGETLAHFRHILVDCVADCLNHPETFDNRLEQLGYLIGYAGLEASPDACQTLRRLLWGALTGADLPRPFSDMVEDDRPEQKRRVRDLFDLWLAAGAPNVTAEGRLGLMPAHQWGAIRTAFDRTAAALAPDRGVGPLTQENIDLLVIFYRGILDADPPYAGRLAFWEMCRLATPDGSKERHRLQQAWYALCWEHGKVLAEKTAWGRVFRRGFDDPHLPAQMSLPCLRVIDKALGYFGPLAADAKRALDTLTLGTDAPAPISDAETRKRTGLAEISFKTDGTITSAGERRNGSGNGSFPILG